MDDKIPGGDEKILAGDTAPKGVLPGSDKGPAGHQDTAEDARDLDADIAYVTRQGGLSILPKNYPEKNGFWRSILSDNPFEVLYLDYRQYASVTPEMVKRHFDLLSLFWRNTVTLLNGVNREKIRSRYGEEPVNTAGKRLQAAYERLKTTEGIQAYFRETDSKRYQHGIKAVAGLVNMALADGELTRQEANTVIAEALKNGLNEVEVRNHLYEILLTEHYKPRSTKTHPDIFDNHWMTDERWAFIHARAKPVITVNNIQVSSPEEIGEVLFRNRDFAGNYIRNANYLPQDIAKLESADKAMPFEEIINRETDPDKRYLKLLYRLNNTLPFRVELDTFKDIRAVLARTRNDYPFFLRVSSLYEKGHIHIWLRECDPAHAAKLTFSYDYNSFLIFIYSIDTRHPFYLKTERFDTPEQLMELARKNKTVWHQIAEAVSNGQLPVWFTGTGKRSWNEAYNNGTEVFMDSQYHNPDEKKLAAVQTLIQVILPQVSSPKIVSDTQSLQLLSVEGSSTLHHPILLRLQNEGYVKARISFDKPVEGISLSEYLISLYSQSGAMEQKLFVVINALQLIKNKNYALNIIITSAYETITIPLEVKVVFPRKAYLFHLLKYALFGALFFGGARLGMGLISGYPSWLGAQPQLAAYPSFSTSAYDLPDNYFLFFVALLLLAAALVISYFVIRKREKI